MYALLLLAGLFSFDEDLTIIPQKQDKMCIVVNDNKLCKALLWDLKVDWSNPKRQMIDYEDLVYLEYLKTEILRSSIIINHLEFDKLKEHRIDHELDSYPAIRLKRYNNIEYYPNDEFVIEPSFAMLYIKVLIDDYYDRDGRIERWTRRCRLVKNKDDVVYERKVLDYVIDVLGPDEDIKLLDSNDIDIGYYKYRYEKDSKFPEYINSPLPEKVKYQMPWELGYTFSPFPEMKTKNRNWDD